MNLRRFWYGHRRIIHIKCRGPGGKADKYGLGDVLGKDWLSCFGKESGIVNTVEIKYMLLFGWRSITRLRTLCADVSYEEQARLNRKTALS